MTTSIYDIYNKAVASDTRWSFTAKLSDGNEYLVFNDDSGFQKLSQRNDKVIIFAGNGQLIAEWKQWWLGPDPDTNQMPMLQDDDGGPVFIIIIDMANNKSLFDFGLKTVMIDNDTHQVVCVLMGSGSHFAAEIWNKIRCYESAILMASNSDNFTSNIVSKIDFETFSPNFEKDSFNYNDIVEAIVRRGKMLKITQQPSKPIDLNTHALGKEVKSLLVGGKVIASAPAPELNDVKWSDEKRLKLKTVLDGIFKDELARN